MNLVPIAWVIQDFITSASQDMLYVPKAYLNCSAYQIEYRGAAGEAHVKLYNVKLLLVQ
jgi:hypothetical protein